ncbi:MAG: hypothetical protein ACJ762_05165 [Solirubrobacteraceae bacterium]
MLAPMMERFLTAHAELWQAHDDLCLRVDEMDRRHAQLVEELAASSATAAELAVRRAEDMDRRYTQLAGEVEAGRSAATDLVAQRTDEMDRRYEQLVEEMAAANALAWDQIALSRRLAQLEERLAALTEPPVPAVPGEQPQA